MISKFEIAKDLRNGVKKILPKTNDKFIAIKLTEMSHDELHEVAADVNMTMKGHVRRFVSGVTATKSAMNNHPAPADKGVV